MKTLKQLCIKSHTVKDKEGNSWTAEQGKFYTTSIPKDNSVIVFSNYWVNVPKDIFVEAE